MTPTAILEEEFKKLIADLVVRYDQLGMRASSEWENNLQLMITTDSGLKAVLTGAAYTRQLISGRKPGKMPPSTPIEDWIRVKGISSDMDIVQLAFVIRRKIAEFGTKYFEQGGTDLIDSVITVERIQAIIDRVAKAYREMFISDYIKEIKTVIAV